LSAGSASDDRTIKIQWTPDNKIEVTQEEIAPPGFVEHRRSFTGFVFSSGAIEYHGGTLDDWTTGPSGAVSAPSKAVFLSHGFPVQKIKFSPGKASYTFVVPEGCRNS